MLHARSLFEVKLPGTGLGAWDLALLGVVAAVLLRPRTWRGRVLALDLILGTSFLAILAWAGYGILRGGDVRQVQMQLSAPLRMFVLYFVVHAVFCTSRDAKRLAWVVAAAAGYRAVACIAFFWFFARTGAVTPYPESMTDHHDSTLWATALIGLVSWALASRRFGSVLASALGAVLLLLAIHYNDRRIAWVEVTGGLVLLYVGMSAGWLRHAIHRYATVLLPVAGLYIIVGWSQPQLIFAPVQQLKSALTDTADASNDARDLENRGLVVTLQNAKLLGTGFGHPFTEVSVLYSAGMEAHFENYRYLPHNSLLGLAAFTGVVGFSVIWAFLPVPSFLAARAYPHARFPLEQSLSMVVFTVPFIYSVQAFGDMGLQSLKANVILAVSTAVAARLAVNTGAWPAALGRHGSAVHGKHPPIEGAAMTDGPAKGRKDEA